jgi:hypothetical protein
MPKTMKISKNSLSWLPKDVQVLQKPDLTARPSCVIVDYHVFDLEGSEYLKLFTQSLAKDGHDATDTFRRCEYSETIKHDFWRMCVGVMKGHEAGLKDSDFRALRPEEISFLVSGTTVTTFKYAINKPLPDQKKSHKLQLLCDYDDLVEKDTHGRCIVKVDIEVFLLVCRSLNDFEGSTTLMESVRSRILSFIDMHPKMTMGQLLQELKWFASPILEDQIRNGMPYEWHKIPFGEMMDFCCATPVGSVGEGESSVYVEWTRMWGPPDARASSIRNYFVHNSLVREDAPVGQVDNIPKGFRLTNMSLDFRNVEEIHPDERLVRGGT